MATPILDQYQADFISSHVSIVMASRSAGNVPSQARALGCRVSADRRHVTLILPVIYSASLLDDLRSGGGIAAVFTRITTYETMQLKGPGATIGAPTDEDRAVLQSYGDSFFADLRQIGYTELFSSVVTRMVREDMVVVKFAPTDAFRQTPGPGAGGRLEAAP
ncbi:MAG: hypothetical protein OEW21_11980 [Betaproteobacteria bacterium]|nr:hypothetical protein [Betaproteobacteria bacterium]